MSIYTKGGDKGTTSLVHTKNVSKSDDRIQLEGTIDELTSHIGVVKTMVSDGDTIRFLEKIQETLITVMAGVADPYNREYKINDDKTELREEEIDRLEAALFPSSYHGLGLIAAAVIIALAVSALWMFRQEEPEEEDIDIEAIDEIFRQATDLVEESDSTR